MQIEFFSCKETKTKNGLNGSYEQRLIEMSVTFSQRLLSLLAHADSLFLFRMKNLFRVGDKKYFEKVVTKDDAAAFDSGEVHPVYSTFALARDAEWTCRQFVLDMKDTDEEGIGTFIHVDHHSPALISETVQFVAVVESLAGNEIVCGFKAEAGSRLVASGRQGQKILKKNKIAALFSSLKHG